MIRTASLALGVCLIAGASAAQAVKLRGHEITALLSGNTAVGKWEGARYRQFFGADGTTVYAEEGRDSARGNWRVDTEGQEYQRRLPSDEDWQGWFVMEYAGAFYWVSKSTPPTPFRLEEGQQLAFED